MKKSFKKAGAAVLSMSMLLAVGASAMPVYAAAEYAPGQLEVTLNTQFADDGTTTATPPNATDVYHKYDYLPAIESATVKVYQVAKLGANGWEWDPAIKSSVEAGNLTFNDPFDATENGPINLSKFEDLLRKVEDINSNESPKPEIPAATSEQMLSLASKLERVVLANSGSISPIATKTMTSNYDILNIPTDTALYSPGTINDIGYYLVLTDTSDSGVLVQPALVVLKNDKDGKNVKQISLKGADIQLDKAIEAALDKTEKVDVAGTSSEANSSTSTSKDTAVVASNDKLTYTIKVPLPRYDARIDNPSDIRDYVLVDTPDDGIVLLDDTGAMVKGVNNETYTIQYKETESDDWDNLPANVTATLQTLPNGATQTSSGTGADTTYTYAVANAGTSNVVGKGGFMVTVPGDSLKNANGGYLLITFYADIDDTKLNRAYVADTEHKAEKDIVDGDVQDNLNALGVNREPTDLTGWIELFKSNDQLKDAAGIDGTEVDNDAVIAKIKTLGDKFTSATTAKPNIAASGGDEDDVICKKTAYLVDAMKRENDAIDKANVTKRQDNGTNNTVRSTYGNDFATGKGDGKGEDITTVYAAKLDLEKVVEEHLIVKENDAQDLTAANSKDQTKTTALGNAVFKLEKDYATNKKASVGYAVTYLDETTDPVTPKLIELTELTYTAPVSPATEGTWEGAPTGATVYEWTEGTGASKTTHKAYYILTGATPSKTAWTALKEGQYTLTEVKAPAGYKKWASPVSFTIDAEEDSAGKDFTGGFSATGDAAYNAVALDRDTDNDGAVEEGVKFHFTQGLDGSEARLETTVVDEYDDKLPATGGIGTVLFTTGGISIVLIAGALFVMYMKKRNAEDEE